jgi:Fic family protein
MQNITDLKGMNHILLCFDPEILKDKFSACKRCLKDSAEYELNADTVLLDSFHSATIEGARTTIESVKRSIGKPKNKSDLMVINNMKALDKIYSGYSIDDSSIRELWNLIVDGVCENIGVMGERYRSGDVYISSLDRIVHTPAPYSEIEDYMSSLFAFMINTTVDSLYKSIIVHFYFVYIHPFCDGNGRTSRILQNYCLYTGGYKGVRKIRISQAINMHLGAYYKALENVEKPVIYENKMMLDLTAFVEYMLDRIMEACHLSEKKQYDLSELERKLLIRMSKRGVGAEITVANAATLMDVSPEKARRILNGLAEKQYLFKGKVEGKNKNLYQLLILIS